MSEEVFHEEIRQVVAELMAFRRRLTEISQSLPIAEEADGSEHNPDGLATFRALLERVIADSLTPAISDLLEASRN